LGKAARQEALSCHADRLVLRHKWSIFSVLFFAAAKKASLFATLFLLLQKWGATRTANRSGAQQNVATFCLRFFAEGKKCEAKRGRKK
jgi:hypothetical protein